MTDEKNRILYLRGHRLDLRTPKVMGILNTTPDSFSDGGIFLPTDRALGRVETMIDEGASVIDIGGESTRPGSDPVSVETEMKRVLPVLEKSIELFPDTLFSVDTTKYEVAKAALERGAHIINDISGLQKEPRLADLCSEYKAGYVLMHSKGDPKHMQDHPVYEDVMDEIGTFFEKRIPKLRKAGVSSIIVDPGIGFGKTLRHNLEIVSSLQRFCSTGYPVLVGASRKSMIGQILGNRPVTDRLSGTLAVHYHCMMQGATLLRVHDVREAMDTVRIFHAIKNRDKTE